MIGQLFLIMQSGPEIRQQESSNNIRPVVSLKSNIKVTGGNGTQASPWQLGI